MDKKKVMANMGAVVTVMSMTTSDKRLLSPYRVECLGRLFHFPKSTLDHDKKNKVKFNLLCQKNIYKL